MSEKSITDKYPSLADTTQPIAHEHLSALVIGNKTLPASFAFRYLTIVSLRSEIYQYSFDPALFVKNDRECLFRPDNPESKVVAEQYPEVEQFAQLFKDFGIIKRVYFDEREVKLAAFFDEVDDSENLERRILDEAVQNNGLRSDLFGFSPHFSVERPSKPLSKRRRAYRVATKPAEAQPDLSPISVKKIPKQMFSPRPR